jgi:hypothetical protein
LTEIRVKPIKPLPEPLPPGERVLWQSAPAWRPFSRRVFHVGKIALYFAIVVSWVALSAWMDAGSGSAVLRSLVWSLPPALGVLALAAGLAWGYARTTVYTITTKRVVIEGGLALTTSVNLPFSKIDRADMKTYKDGTGDIELELSGPRLLYSMIWPNLRWLRITRPVPTLRALEQPHQVAELLTRALADDQQPAAPPQQATAGADLEAKPEMRQSATS